MIKTKLKIYIYYVYTMLMCIYYDIRIKLNRSTMSYLIVRSIDKLRKAIERKK
jgi:hypothetical protein